MWFGFVVYHRKIRLTQLWVGLSWVVAISLLTQITKEIFITTFMSSGSFRCISTCFFIDFFFWSRRKSHRTLLIHTCCSCHFFVMLQTTSTLQSHTSQRTNPVVIIAACTLHSTLFVSSHDLHSPHYISLKKNRL